MDEQLTAAAQRLRTGDYEQSEHGHISEAGLFQLAQDEHEVAAAYLAEHPADDEMAVDEAWLRSVGFEQDSFGMWNLFPWGFLGHSFSWSSIDGDWEGEVVFDRKRWPHPLKTREDVRRLCLAINIPLKCLT